MKIIEHSNVEVATSYSRIFSYTPDHFTAGFGFPCDECGNVAVDTTGAAFGNYQECLTGFINGEKIYDLGVQKFEHTYRNPAIGECDCGCEVVLSCFTNTCECGADYNSAGQRLAFREFWGEETGEHWTECY